MKAKTVTALNREKLRGAIICLASSRSMTKSRFHKTLYLVEREAVLRTGKTVIGARFKREQFGMWSPDVADELDDMVTEGLLQERKALADSGEGRRYTALVPVTADAELVSFCTAVQDSYGKMGLTKLIASAKQTAPFVYASKKGETLNWSLLAEERCDSPHKITPETEAELRETEAKLRSGRGRVLTREDALQALESLG